MLHDEIISDLLDIESDLEQPVFTWNGQDYSCVASMFQLTRQLDNGGYATDEALNLTVRLLDATGNATFSDALPQAQETLTFQGTEYRILTAKVHPLGSHMRIIAVGTTRGL